MVRSNARDRADGIIRTLADGSVVAADIGDGVITDAKIATGAITNTKLVPSARAGAQGRVNLTFDSAQTLDLSQGNFFDADSTSGTNTTLSFANVPTAAKWNYKVKHGGSLQDVGLKDSTVAGIQYNDNYIGGLFDDNLASGTYATVVGDNGTKHYSLSYNSDTLVQRNFGTAYDLTTLDSNRVGIFNFGAATGLGADLILRAPRFHPKGEKVYIQHYGNVAQAPIIYSYTLGTAWDVSTIDSTSQASIDISGTVAAQASGIEFSLDGTTMITSTNVAPDTFYQFTLSTPWDITTASYASKSFDITTVVPSWMAIIYAFNFTNDEGTKGIIMDVRGNLVGVSLSTGYDISTISKVDSVSLNEIIGQVGFALTDLDLGMPADSGDYKYGYISTGTAGNNTVYRLESPASSVQSTLSLPAAVKNSLSATPSVSNPVQHIEFMTTDSGVNIHITNDFVTAS